MPPGTHGLYPRGLTVLSLPPGTLCLCLWELLVFASRECWPLPPGTLSFCLRGLKVFASGDSRSLPPGTLAASRELGRLRGIEPPLKTRTASGDSDRVWELGLPPQILPTSISSSYFMLFALSPLGRIVGLHLDLVVLIVRSEDYATFIGKFRCNLIS